MGHRVRSTTSDFSLTLTSQVFGCVSVQQLVSRVTKHHNLDLSRLPLPLHSGIRQAVMCFKLVSSIVSTVFILLSSVHVMIRVVRICKRQIFSYFIRYN